MAQRKSWLPREGLTLDVVQTIVKQTALNPVLTVPLWLLSRYTNSGRGYALDNPKAIRNLRVLLYLGVARYINGLLNRGSQNHWTAAKPDWKRELVLITGGSDGIGKLLVKYFSQRGVKVIIFDIQEPTFETYKSLVSFVKVDLTDPEAIVAASNQVKQQYGNPSVLILNAGITNRHSIINTPDYLLRRVFDLNTLSHYRLAREFLPAMIKANHGLVCSTASLAGYVTCPGMVDYNSTKASVVAFHEGLTVELSERYNAPAVRTICICPNFVRTKLADGFVNDSKFINPTLEPETVAEIQFDRIWRWEGGIVPIPSYHNGVTLNVRALPTWIQIGMRKGLSKVMLGVETAELDRIQKLKEQEETRLGSESVVEVSEEGSFGETTMFA